MNESEGVPPFSLSIPTRSSDALPVTLQAGDTLFVVGANGTGKSSLMHRQRQISGRTPKAKLGLPS